MKIILFGKDGQCGRALRPVLEDKGQLVAFGRLEADFSCPQTLAEIIRREKPDQVVNAAAYTAVDKAEDEPDLARVVNTEAPAVIANAAKELGAWLIHISTDYVYDGQKDGAYCEEDTAHPLSVYGKTKLAGDEAVRAAGGHHLILRTSWVYGTEGKNFPTTILNLAATREELKIVADQRGAPCSTALLADVIGRIIDQLDSTSQKSGLYHVAPKGETTWANYAKLLVEEGRRYGANLAVQRIIPISAADYGAKASRPANSLLDCRKIEATFGLTLPEWQQDVRNFVRDYFGEKQHG